MHVNLEFAKRHKAAVVGGLVGLVVLYVIYKYSAHVSTPASSSTLPDLSGGGTAVTNLAAAASLTNAQLNAQVTTAAYAAGVQQNQTNAQLEASLAMTAAELAAQQQKTTADAAVALTGIQAAVTMQEIVSGADVQKTAITASALDTLAATAAQEQIKLAQIKAATDRVMLGTIADQVNQVFKRGDFSSNAPALATIIAEETGQGGSAGTIASSLAYKQVATSPGTQFGQIAGGVAKVLGGLFA